MLCETEIERYALLAALKREQLEGLKSAGIQPRPEKSYVLQKLSPPGIKPRGGKKNPRPTKPRTEPYVPSELDIAVHRYFEKYPAPSKGSPPASSGGKDGATGSPSGKKTLT